MEIIETIDLNRLDEEHLRAVSQMKVICYIKMRGIENFEKSLQYLKNKYPKDVKRVIFEAQGFQELKSAEDAIDLLIKEKANFPDSIEIKLRLASIYREVKKYPEALASAKENVEVLQNINSYEYACEVAFEANEPDEVLSIINQAEHRNIKSETLIHYKAIALTMQEKYDDALDLFRTFDETLLTNNDYRCYALCLAKRSEQEKAIELLQKAKEKYPGNVAIVSALSRLYLEVDLRSVFNEAKLWLQLAPEDRTAYFVIMQTGFVIGEAYAAHQAMTEYLSRFGESPNFKRVSLDEIKEIGKEKLEREERLWKVYQDGLLPEVILSQSFIDGIGGFRITLLESPDRVVAFDGNIDSQNKQLFNTLTAKEGLLDYHAVLTICLLDLIEPILNLFGCVGIPETVIDQTRVDLTKLPLNYQQDIRFLEEQVF